MRKKIAFWILSIFGVYLIIVLSRELWRILGTSSRFEVAEEKVEQLTLEQEELKQELAESETDAFVEKEARDKLLYAREGEVVVLLPQVDQVDQVNQVDNVEERELKNWEKWWKLFDY